MCHQTIFVAPLPVVTGAPVVAVGAGPASAGAGVLVGWALAPPAAGVAVAASPPHAARSGISKASTAAWANRRVQNVLCFMAVFPPRAPKGGSVGRCLPVVTGSLPILS